MAAVDDIPAHEWEQLARVLDARIDELSEQQREIAIERAQRRLGLAELDAEDHQHVRVLWDELRAAALRGLLEQLVAEGELEIAGVSDDGHLLHRRPSGG